MIRKMIKRRACLGLILAAAMSHGASALDFSFVQDGYEGDNEVSLSFSGEDVDNDGWLIYFPSEGYTELSSFVMNFGQSSLPPLFSLGIGDLMGLAFYYEGDGVLGNDMGADLIANPYQVEGVYASSGLYDYMSGLAILGSEGGMVMDYENQGSYSTQKAASSSAPSGEAVPDTGVSLAAIGLLLGGLLGVKRMGSRS